MEAIQRIWMKLGQFWDWHFCFVSNYIHHHWNNCQKKHFHSYILERKMGRSVEVKPYLSCQECLCNGILCLRYTVIQNPAATTIVGWSGQISQYITNNDLPSWAILFLQYCPPEGPIPASDVAMKLAHMDDVHKFWVLLWVNWRSAQEWLWHRAKEHMLHEIAQ